MRDKLELYNPGMAQPFLTLESSFKPAIGDVICIQKIFYKVTKGNFTVDYAGTSEVCIVWNIIVEKI